MIDTGGLEAIPDGLLGTIVIGDEKNTFPRDVNEGFLYNTPGEDRQGGSRGGCGRPDALRR